MFVQNAVKNSIKLLIAARIIQTKSVTRYALVFLVYLGSSTITKTVFTKCCMVDCSIQNIRAITTQKESSICKLVEQKLIYVT